MGVPELDSQTRENEKDDLKYTAISLSKNISSLDLRHAPHKHIGVCEPPFAGHLLGDERATEHVPSEADDFGPSLALQGNTVVFRTFLLEIEGRVTTKVEKMEHKMVERAQSLETQIKENTACINKEKTWSPISPN